MLTLVGQQGYRRVGAQSGKGPEWAGPCPVCGGGQGSDRFHIWPEQGQAGTFWCRRCDKGGDLVEYYRWAENLSYRDACAKAGVDAATYAPQNAPVARGGKNSQARWQPAAPTAVVNLWADHAAKFAEWCHLQLLANEGILSWLAKRGINGGQVAKFGLGWNPADTYRPRPSWGLEPMAKDNGKPRKLWLPEGLVIPQYLDGRVVRMRIRRPDGEPKYYVVPGSGREPLLTKEGASAYVVVESELDAVLLDGFVCDLVGVVAMGNASAKPTERCHAQLAAAVHLSISLDSDAPRHNPATGKTESAGAQGSRWWLEHYRHAVRVPVIGGKDPGDAFQAGVDLRTWVLAGLPPRYHLKAAAVAAMPTPVPAQPPEAITALIGEATDKESLPVADEPAVKHYQLTVGEQEIHVTDNRGLWEELSAAGAIVFSEQELARLQAACATMDASEKAAFIARAIDTKHIFPGAYIRRGEVCA